MPSSKPIGALGRTEAAEFLAISVRHLDNLLANRALPKIKIGRKVVVRLVDLERYLDRMARSA